MKYYNFNIFKYILKNYIIYSCDGNIENYLVIK